MVYKQFVLDSIIPTSERSDDYLYYLTVPSDTGFQINTASNDAGNRCNWNSPPPTSTQLVERHEEFYLVRCNLGTGVAKITLLKQPRHGLNPTATSIETFGPIEQSWHRRDHQVGFAIGNPFMEGARPAHLPADYQPNIADSKAAIYAAALKWREVQSYVTFETVSTAPDTTIKGYWNPGIPEDMCGGSIACVRPDGTYPHQGHYPMWIEYPPQFPGDTNSKQWTNSYKEADNSRADFYYLPATVVHEFGHTAGLGHSPNGMGIMAGTLVEAPQTYDIGGMIHAYSNHTKNH
ncbi:MAG: matrixin family metalloprotease [Chloroflexi bacterium]|nr:matrixin family metalloprotease [Chloroflexota bacterium]